MAKKEEKKKKILPRGKYMLVRQDAPEARETAQGIIIPSSEEQEEKAQGTVEAVGIEIKDVKKGDSVIFGAYAGEKLEVIENHKKVVYRLLHDDDVIATIVD